MEVKDFEIVCVDDDQDVLQITTHYLESMSCKTVAFTNVQEAVEYISHHKHKISLIFSDLRMDNINGFEFKKVLKDTANEIPFVILTGYWTKDMSKEAMELGIDAFVEKPVVEEVLKEYVDKFGVIRAEMLIEEREMVEGFLEESSPMLDEIESLILELEENPDSDQTLSVYFRLLHTIKGTASCVGLTRLGDYTHQYEDFIGELRNKIIPVNTATTNVLLEGLDDLKHFFNTINEEFNDRHLDIQDKFQKYDIKNLNFEESEKVAIDENSKKGSQDEASQKNKKDDEKMTVPMVLLNDFMEESGELTVIRNSILKTVKKIENKFRGDKDIELLNELLDGMYNVTSNIQGKITEMRKVPLHNTFRPFKRLIRDLSKQLGKEVELTISGDQISVDNKIAKLFSNTLIHILRNSLDHGLETSEKRIAVGKNPTGVLDISVEEIGEDIVLKIADDGNGINPEIIKQKALEKGLYPAEELAEMSDLELVNIIFASGFSTAEVVSDLSGRGVGMDMVRGSFEAMDGSVFVMSETGKGSTFTLTVPIPKSVLIINTLLVKASKENFIFHMDEVSEVIRYEVETPNSKMYNVDNQLILNHNGHMIQLISLANHLNLDDSKTINDIQNIVVLRVGNSRFGVLVDEIYEFEEVVSRKISDQIESNYLYHGASLLGTGEVAMIISAEGLAQKACLEICMDNKSQYLNHVEAEKNGSEFSEEFMLFKYNEQKFLCLHLDEVERLEKLQPSTIEKVGDNYIVRYLNKVLPIVEPASSVGLQDFSMESFLEEKGDELLEVIVVNIAGEKIGLLVHELDEIQKTYEKINYDTIVNEGLKGSVFINGQTVCVIDLDYIHYNTKHKKLMNKKVFHNIAA